MIHPSLYYTDGDIAAVGRRIRQDNVAADMFSRFTAKAEKLLAAELYSYDYAISANTQHGNFYAVGAQLNNFAEVLCPLYLLTGDTRCLHRVRDALLHYAEYEAWTGPSNIQRETPWHSDLSTTRIASAFALAYDALYASLSCGERDRIADALWHLGIKPLLDDWVLPESRIHALDSMGHNWWSVCIALAGVSLIPIADRIPDSNRYFALIDEALIGFRDFRGSMLLNKTSNFNRDGLFYESAGYFNYGIGEYLRYVYCRRRAGADVTSLTDGVINLSGDALMSLRYPVSDKDSLFVNFGDSASAADMSLFSRYFLLSGGKSALVEDYYTHNRHGIDICDITHYDELYNRGAESASLPDERLLGNEIYLRRSGAAEGGTLFALRCGFTWNHAHEDAGSFVIFDRGKPLVTDSGVCSYSDPKYVGYYCRSAAHNVITADGEGQSSENFYRGSKFAGEITDALRSPALTRIQVDATGPAAAICSRNYRTVLILSPETYLFIDDVRCHRDATIEFNLHYNGECSESDDSLLIQNESSRLQLRSLTPYTVLTRKTGYAEGAPDVPVGYYAVSTVDICRQSAMMNLLLLNDSIENINSEPLSGTDYLGVRLSGAVDAEVYFNLRADGRNMHINTSNMLGAYETDAYLLTVAGGQLHADYCSYIRRSGSVLYSSFKKENVILPL